MSDLVTMRITLDPVTKEQFKLRGIERGMTPSELVTKLAMAALHSEASDTEIASLPDDAMPQDLTRAEVVEIEEPEPPEPSVQEIMSELLAEHGNRITKAVGPITACTQRIEQLCNQQQARIDKAAEVAGRRAELAVELSNARWQRILDVRRSDRYWLGGTAVATLLAMAVIFALVSGTGLGRRVAVWQAGADTEWQAAQLLASSGSYLHGQLMAETKALLDKPEFLSPYAKCVERAKAAKSSVRCNLVMPALTRGP
ncbi:MAG: hypothetical protein HC788_05700 [Sphingopyxis sp.]|nr:hypothetical protein [Sphingopyxis sp.]